MSETSHQILTAPRRSQLDLRSYLDEYEKGSLANESQESGPLTVSQTTRNLLSGILEQAAFQLARRAVDTPDDKNLIRDTKSLVDLYVKIERINQTAEKCSASRAKEPAEQLEVEFVPISAAVPGECCGTVTNDSGKAERARAEAERSELPVTGRAASTAQLRKADRKAGRAQRRKARRGAVSANSTPGVSPKLDFSAGGGLANGLTVANAAGAFASDMRHKQDAHAATR